MSHGRKTERGRGSTPAGGLNGIVLGRAIEFELPLAEIGEAELIDRGRADGRSMTYIDLLRTRCVNTREVPQRGPFGLKFRERIEGVVVIKIVVDSRFLIIVKRMVDLDLELIAAVSLFWNGDNRVRGSPRAGHILQLA